mgnify:CR=1 FL=1
MNLPKHLGGHLNKTHTDEGTLDYFIKNFDIKSFLDIGCGPGGQVELAQNKGLRAIGIDGDYTLKRNIECIIHDFTQGPLNFNDQYDLGWSVEFVEHVEEQYMKNYIPLYQKCKFLVLTHALPGESGHHHVNCQTTNYWIKQLAEYGLIFDQDLTDKIRKISNMKKKFVQRRGLVFKNTIIF